MIGETIVRIQRIKKHNTDIETEFMIKKDPFEVGLTVSKESRILVLNSF